jgi:hypothetical protein
MTDDAVFIELGIKEVHKLRVIVVGSLLKQFSSSVKIILYFLVITGQRVIKIILILFGQYLTDYIF